MAAAYDRVSLSADLERLRITSIKEPKPPIDVLYHRHKLVGEIISAFISSASASRLGATVTLSLQEADSRDRCVEYRATRRSKGKVQTSKYSDQAAGVGEGAGAMTRVRDPALHSAPLHLQVSIRSNTFCTSPSNSINLKLPQDRPRMVSDAHDAPSAEPPTASDSREALSADIIESGAFQCETLIRASVISGVTEFQPASVEMDVTVTIRCELKKRAAISVTLDDVAFELGRSAAPGSEFDELDNVMCDGVGIPVWRSGPPGLIFIFAGAAPWTAGCVVLTLAEGDHRLGQPGAADAALVRRAVDRLNRDTAPFLRWRLVPWAERESYRHIAHIGYYSPGPAYAHIGMLRWQSQRINLPQWVEEGTVIHELLHTAGLLHEHQRHDRDRHVEFFPQNCLAEYHSQFSKLPRQQSLGPYYDVDSIMHYPWDAFQRRPGDPACIVLRPLNGIALNRIGQQDAMSDHDKIAVRGLYPTQLVDAGAGSSRLFSESPWAASMYLKGEWFTSWPYRITVPALSHLFFGSRFWDEMAVAHEYRGPAIGAQPPADVRYTEIPLGIAMPGLAVAFPVAGHAELLAAFGNAPAGSALRLYAFNKRVFRISLRLPHAVAALVPAASLDIASAFCRCMGAPRLPVDAPQGDPAAFEKYRSAACGVHSFAVARVCQTHVFLEVCKNVAQLPFSNAPDAPVRAVDIVGCAAVAY